MIRNFMRVTFPKVLDILFVVSIIVVVIAASSTATISSRLHMQGFFMPFISVLLPGVVGVVVAFGVIYVLLDIRDALQGKKQE